MVTYIDYIHNFVIRTLIDWKPGQISITVIDQLFKANKRVISITRSKGVAPLFTSSELYFFYFVWRRVFTIHEWKQIRCDKFIWVIRTLIIVKKVLYTCRLLMWLRHPIKVNQISLFVFSERNGEVPWEEWDGCWKGLGGRILQAGLPREGPRRWCGKSPPPNFFFPHTQMHPHTLLTVCRNMCS